MQVDYVPFIGRVIKNYEGGYGWDKRDPGGPTNYGITCFDLAEFEHKRMNSMAAWAEPVRNMPLSSAEIIYQIKYARGIRFDGLNSGVDCCMLDYGINSGISRPIRVARAIVGLPAGGMDDALVAAINKVEASKFIDTMCGERLRFMHAIKGGAAWQEFGHGWGARVADLNAYCRHLAAGGVHDTAPTPVDLSHVVTPKATNVPKTASTATIGSAGTAAAAAHAAGFPWSTVAVIGMGVIIAGTIYEAVHDQAAIAANAKVHL